MSRRTTQGKPTHILGTARRSGAFGSALAHAERILDLDRKLAGWLDPPIKGHCRVASFGEESVVLEVDSPVWSQRVRFLLPELTRLFARRVVLKVRPLATPRAAPALRPTRLSAPAASLLAELAAATDNRALSEVLRRLAERGPPR